MINSFTFNGVSSETIGLYVGGQNTFGSPQRDVTKVSIPGRNGDLVRDNGKFLNSEISYNIVAMADFAETAMAVRNWLLSVKGYARLEDTYHPDHFRMARVADTISFETSAYNQTGKAQVVFDCKPQRFLKSGDDEVTVEPQTTTLSGSLLTFDTPVATSMDKAEVALIPVQSGTGDPSPTNVRPISGHTEAKLWVASSYDPTIPATVSVELSKNKFTDFFKIGKNISGGTVVDRPANDRCATVNGCAVLAETQYTISFSGGGSVGVYYYDTTDTFISQGTGWQASPFTFTTPQNTARVRFSYNTGTPPTDVQLELGATATTYTAAIIYGGTYDFVTGKLTLTWKGVRGSDVTWVWFTHASGDVPYFDAPDKKAGRTNFYCSAYRVVDKDWSLLASGETTETATYRRIVVRDNRWTSLSDAVADLASVQFVYELATPLEFTLTAQQVQTLVGENNVWSNSGDISIEYTAPFSIMNPTPFESRPLIRVYGSGNGTITVGNHIITLTDIVDYIDIDSETMNCYNGSTNCNSKVTLGSQGFPVLPPGNTGVSFSGGTTSVEITPRWWEL